MCSNQKGINATTTVGSCNWIPWESLWVQKLPDPTRVFSLLVIGIMVIRFLITTDWDFGLVLAGFFFNPYVVVFFSLACLVLYLGLKNESAAQLPIYDRWTAEWYWWNAWLYHMTMDGASGSFRAVPVVVQQYDQLDLRFPDRHVVPWGIGCIELFIMGPMSLWTLWAVLQRNPLRFPLELVTSTLQFFGMVLFVAAEVYEGQLNVPALDPVGVPGNPWANVKLNLYHFTYYWFGFWFCNFIWFFIPLFRIHRALDECRLALATTVASPTKKSD